ncbi:MAG TPA: fibronectin type III domain-containing protein [Candidatus Angelobacter sp.]|nr:fibronectin type III domain-containing protein [Candidatus Angelobacter sp.]
MLRTKTLGLLVVLALALPVAAQKPQAERITNGPVVEGVGDTWAVIAWTTNTGGSTVVRYGTDERNLNETAQAPYADNEKTQAQNHRVHLNNLKPNTTYFFVVVSGQGEGTGTEARSQTGQFKTKPGK